MSHFFPPSYVPQLTTYNNRPGNKRKAQIYLILLLWELLEDDPQAWVELSIFMYHFSKVWAAMENDDWAKGVPSNVILNKSSPVCANSQVLSFWVRERHFFWNGDLTAPEGSQNTPLWLALF